MSDFVIKRGFLPRNPDVSTEGWLRVAERGEGFTPFHRVDVEVSTLEFDDSGKIPDDHSTRGETRVHFTGHIALDGSQQPIEGDFFQSGHRMGTMRVTEPGF